MKIKKGTKVYTPDRTDGIYSHMMECVVIGHDENCYEVSRPFAYPFYVHEDDVFLTKKAAYEKQAELVREDLTRKQFFLQHLEQLIEGTKDE